jgi:phosphatidylserine/phosphatidylglycerophosphate/cardiolipin synthase-like enzyme
MEREELLRRMWGRVRHCRHLAIMTTDLDTAHALIAMANEGEADIRRLMDDIPCTPEDGDASQITAPVVRASDAATE